jgi:heme-degrading monooxygenase HmoA
MRSLLFVSLIMSSACGSPADENFPASCIRSVLETDLGQPALRGPGVDPTTTRLAEGTYVISTTYLQVRSGEGMKTFQPLSRELTAFFSTSPGVVASALVGSPSCQTARTLVVWRDEQAMFDFVTSPVHRRAVQATATISRGGSVFLHWTGPASEATWDEAVRRMSVSARPEY